MSFAPFDFSEADRASERNYDAFWTQTPLNMARFSDSPIKTPKPDDIYYGFPPARHVTSYLEEYVDSHVYAGRTL
jgi:dimethylaniline monooxygenase (N-oxide forming)